MTKLMKFGSLFAGIGGFDLGFERAGMECVWQVDNDERASAVLKHHWPNVERYGDVRDVGRHNLKTVDLICGGFPCQDVSVAGKRKGLAGKRSGLWFEFHRVLGELRPRWAVIENVPGLLSSNEGRDFAVILQGLVEIGYGVCWRVFDAQYSGVAQRRRRVFIVGHLGDGRAAEILFEREGGCWHPPPSRETGEGVTGTLEARTGAGGFPGTDGAIAGHVIPDPAYALADANGKRTGSGRDGQDTFVVFDRSTAQVSGEIAGPLRVGGAASEGINDGKPDFQCVAFQAKASAKNSMNPSRIAPTLSVGKAGGASVAGFLPGQTARAGTIGYQEQQAPTLKGSSSGTNQVGGVIGNFGVRRLTPVECERLQGFPDNWTAEQSDTQRYRQLGNAVAVPVAEWIGHKILRLP